MVDKPGQAVADAAELGNKSRGAYDSSRGGCELKKAIDHVERSVSCTAVGERG